MLREEFTRTVLRNPFIPTFANAHTIEDDQQRALALTRPSVQQTKFLTYFGRECLYGGAGGGGKTDALLMAALQYVHLYPVRSLLVRRTYKQLSADDGLILRAKSWFRCLGHTPATVHWNEKDHRFTFLKTGATLSFRNLDCERDKDNFQGPGWDFIGGDELTQFKEDQYLYFFTRNRKSPGLPVPSRVRGASNPGRVGHLWCKNRFVIPDASCHFVPAKIADNPGIDEADYVAGLVKVDPITRAQMMTGDWDAYEGGRFHAKWFRLYDVGKDPNGNWRYYLQTGKTLTGEPAFDPEGVTVTQCYNVSATDPAARAEDANDFTAFVTAAVTPSKEILILNVVREQIPIERIVPRLAEVCRDYSPSWVGMEDAGFQLALIREAQRHPDIPAVRRLSPAGKGKLERATPAIIRAEEGQIYLPDKTLKDEDGNLVHPWVDDFLAELITFTGDDKEDAHDDVVDALAYLVSSLENAGLLAPVVVEPEPEPEEAGWGWDHEGEYLGGWKR